MRWRVALCALACAALAQRAAAAPRVSVEVTERAQAEARNNEINWDAKRPRAIQELRVGRPLTQQALKVGEDTLRLALVGLLPGTGYEVRVSHAGTIPATVRVAFSAAGRRAQTPPRRALLDVQKLEFRTDAAGAVLGVGRAAGAAKTPPHVLVTAQRHGVHAQGASGGGGLLVVDVVLSPLLHGLPAEAHQLRPWLLGCALFVAVALFGVPVGGLLRHPAQRFWDKRQGASLR